MSHKTRPNTSEVELLTAASTVLKITGSETDVTHQSLVFAHIRLLHVAYFLIIRKTIKGTNPNAGSCFSSSTRTRTYSHVI